MSKSLPNFLDIRKLRREQQEIFEKNVSDSLYSEYLNLKEQLKQIKPKRQGELNVIHKKYDAERKELLSQAADSLEKMSQLTGISAWDLTSLIGGYYIND